jgi:hypothetical protein
MLSSGPAAEADPSFLASGGDAAAARTRGGDAARGPRLAYRSPTPTRTASARRRPFPASRARYPGRHDRPVCGSDPGRLEGLITLEGSGCYGHIVNLAGGTRRSPVPEDQRTPHPRSSTAARELRVFESGALAIPGREGRPAAADRPPRPLARDPVAHVPDGRRRLMMGQANVFYRYFPRRFSRRSTAIRTRTPSLQCWTRLAERMARGRLLDRRHRELVVDADTKVVGVSSAGFIQRWRKAMNRPPGVPEEIDVPFRCRCWRTTRGRRSSRRADAAPALVR